MTPPRNTVDSANTRDGFNGAPPFVHRPFSDPNLLSPEDAFFAQPPPRQQRERRLNSKTIDEHINTGDLAAARAGGGTRRRREKERGRSGSRKNKGVWKKLLWVKQSCMILQHRYGTHNTMEKILTN